MDARHSPSQQKHNDTHFEHINWKFESTLACSTVCYQSKKLTWFEWISMCLCWIIGNHNLLAISDSFANQSKIDYHLSFNISKLWQIFIVNFILDEAAMAAM